jgi:hypothetical protein
MTYPSTYGSVYTGVAPVSTWSGTLADPAGFSAPLPAASSLEIPIENTGDVGNWLVAFCGWSTGGADVTVTVGVGDDAHNRWEPLGAPSGTFDAVGLDTSGSSVWATPNPGRAGNVFISPNAGVVAMACLVVEFAGLSPWMTLSGVATLFNNGQPMSLPAPPTNVPLNANPTFAPGVTPWAGANNAVITRASVWGVGADFSLMITPDGVTTNPGAVSENTIPVTPGSAYTASAWFVTAQEWANATIAINWFNSSGGSLGLTTSTSYQLNAGQGVLASVSGEAPSGAAFAQIAVQMAGTPPAGLPLFVSNAMIGVPASALLLSAMSYDNNTATVTGPGTGWTSFPAVVASDGVDDSSDCTMLASWQVTSAAATATYNAAPLPGSGPSIAAMATGMLVTGVAPAPPNGTNWPLVQAQAAYGAGATTPWDQLTWTGITARFRAMNTGRGKQYELDTIQAGQGNWTLANNDGWLTPGNGNSPVFPLVQAYTPVRLLVTWPPPPAANSRTYCVTRAFMERWPQALTTARYQNTNAVSTDMWALLTTQLKTIARAEVLADVPVVYLPLDDPAGSTSGSNLAPTQAGPVLVVPSKYGPGAATAAFGADASYLAGDPSASSWELSGLAVANQGYTLYYSDPNLPPTDFGVTIEGWFLVDTSAPPADQILMRVKNNKGSQIQVALHQANGEMYVTTWDRYTGAATQTNVSTVSWQTGVWFQVVLQWENSFWNLYVNGGSAVNTTGNSALLADSPWWVSFDGEADALGTGFFFDGQVAHVSIYLGWLPLERIVTHYLAMLTGLYGNDTTGQRIDRLLGAGNCALPRCIPAGTDLVVGAVDVQGQTVGQNVVNISESDASLLMVDGPGYLYSQSRRGGYNLPVSWTFGGVVAAPLNANWNFATGISPWGPFPGGTSLTWSTVWAYQGQHSMLLSGNGSVTPQAAGELVPVTPGVSYTATAWVMSPQGCTAQVGINWWDGGGVFAGVYPAYVTLLPGVPVLLTAAGPAPTGATSGQMFVEIAGTPLPSVELFIGRAIIMTTETEEPFLADIATDFDPTQVYNDLTLTQLASPQVIGGAATGVTVAVASAASMAQFGDQTLQETVYLSDPNAITDLGYWILNGFDTPDTRVAQMTLDPAANPALWPVVLGVETGQVSQFNLRLAGTELEVTGQFQIMTVGHNTQPGSWKTTLTMVPYIGNVLTCDDVSRGLLDGENPLGW